MRLAVEAIEAEEFSLHATGRDAALCGRLQDHLVLDTYREVMEAEGRHVVPLAVRLHNEIPLGMGCGSSAAALLAGVALANHFGNLGWDDEAIVAEASRREGHPDNVAACWWGGFTVSAPVQSGGQRGVQQATFAGSAQWDMLLALPPVGLPTRTARAVLPERYSRADAVFNVQRTALLTAAFAQERLDLLREATADRLHQPYRAELCPLLPLALSLVSPPMPVPVTAGPGSAASREETVGEAPMFAAATLSGAGPAVLLFLLPGTTPLQAEARLRGVLPGETEVLAVRIAGGATVEPMASE